MMRLRLSGLAALLVVALSVAACGAADTPSTAPLAPTVAAATATNPPLTAFGLTEDGLYFRGNPAATVTVIDYSDFL